MPSASAPPATAFLPARWPPRLYFTFAHGSLLLASGLVAADPRGIGGFFYHPKMLAVVHLVTLGWISSSILGSLYIVLPLAFRAALPAGKRDVVAFAAWAIGVSGMVFHFWIDHPNGMAWAAGLVLLVFAYVAARGLSALRQSPLTASETRPLRYALGNVVGASAAGVLLGVDKVTPILPVPHLAGVFAHAHLAALGFATMMVVGAGYRLLPMVLPAAMPKGFAVTASALALESGVLGLFVALAGFPRLVPLFAVTVILGIGSFLSRVGWMLWHRRAAPGGRARPDASVGHVLQAVGYLVLAAATGVFLVFAPPGETALRATMLYGVFGLVGFLSQSVVGVQARIFPMAAWLQGHADRDYRAQPPPLREAASPRLQRIGLALWTSGVPALALGLALDRAAWTAVGAALLAFATLLGGVSLWRVARALA